MKLKLFKDPQLYNPQPDNQPNQEVGRENLRKTGWGS